MTRGKPQQFKLHDIYQGRIFQRGEYRHFSARAALETFAARNIHAVIDVSPCPHYTLQEKMGRHYLFATYSDSGVFDAVVPERAAAFGIEYLKMGSSVVVNCRAGRNRSSMVSAIMLMDFFGMDADTAIHTIRKVRVNALANPHFVEYLKERKSNGLTNNHNS